MDSRFRGSDIWQCGPPSPSLFDRAKTRPYNDTQPDEHRHGRTAMFGSLFKRGKKPNESASVDESVRAARPGDVFTLSGFTLEFEDTYFLVEKRNRYESPSAEWHEVLGVEGDKKVWIEWFDPAGPTLAAREDGRPTGLKQAGLSEDTLIRMDEEHSIDNMLTYEGAAYRYENSGEALFFEHGRGDGEGFYLWEFTSEEASKVLSVVKWEGVPFQVYVSDLLPFDSVSVYNQ